LTKLSYIDNKNVGFTTAYDDSDKNKHKLTTQKEVDEANRVEIKKFKQEFENGDINVSAKVAYIYVEAFQDYSNAILA